MCRDPYCHICNSPPKEHHYCDDNCCPPQKDYDYPPRLDFPPRPDFCDDKDFPPRPDFCFPEKDCPDKKDPDDKKCPDIQTHNHEFAGSVMIAGKIPHNHRFAGVTSEAIPYKKSHVHAILVNTDFFFNHYHELGIRTGPAIDVGYGKHIHLVEGETTENFGHDHDFIFTTFIENPLQKGRK